MVFYALCNFGENAGIIFGIFICGKCKNFFTIMERYSIINRMWEKPEKVVDFSLQTGI
jgi:hypothetical protein